jgi:hypothetical protein
MNDIHDLLTRLVDVEPRIDARDVLEGAELRAHALRARRARRRFVAAGTVAAAIAAIAIVVVNVNDDGGNGRIAVAPVSTPTSAKSPSVATPQRYSADATVLQDPRHGPELCFMVALSNPPQCSGTPIAGWDWKKILGEESANGTTWGEFHIVGTYDGTKITITEAPTKAHTPPPVKLPDYTTPCPTPPGGWKVVDRSKFTIDDYNAFASTDRAQPDAAGLWLDSKTPVDGSTNLFPEQVLNVAFTGDLDAHRAQLRALWGGPFCVLHHDRSTAQLQAIQKELSGSVGKELGLQTSPADFQGSIDEVNNDISFDVMVATPAAQAALDQRYGAGLVHLHGLLTPVP